MPVDLDDVPAASHPFAGQGLKWHDLLNRTVQLDTVGIHQDSQVGEMVLGRRNHSLPDDASLALAITQ